MPIIHLPLCIKYIYGKAKQFPKHLEVLTVYIYGYININTGSTAYIYVYI